MLRAVVDKVQLPERVAELITQRLRASQADLERARERTSVRSRPPTGAPSED